MYKTVYFAVKQQNTSLNSLAGLWFIYTVDLHR